MRISDTWYTFLLGVGAGFAIGLLVAAAIVDGWMRVAP